MVYLCADAVLCCIWSCLMCIHGKQNGYSVNSKLGEVVIRPIASTMVCLVCSPVISCHTSYVYCTINGNIEYGGITLKRYSHGNQLVSWVLQMLCNICMRIVEGVGGILFGNNWHRFALVFSIQTLPSSQRALG